MEGVFPNQLHSTRNDSQLIPDGIELLAKCADMEIMKQTILKSANVWLYPADSTNTMEFFFVHEGELELMLDEGPLRLQKGESFSVRGLPHEVSCRAHSDTTLIYVSNQPMFEDALDFETYIRHLISQINEKDQYTYEHSSHVMHYSTAIYNEMYAQEPNREAILNDMIIAALFHDVGKCYTPDEILKKKGKLDPEEWKLICHHPMDSGRLLRRYYSERVAEIAEHHHERLDGSGYPYGLTGEEISTEAKIVAVADAFDAMTTNRGYNKVKGFVESAEELYNLPEKFDRAVTEVLCRIVRNGSLTESQDHAEK